VTATTFVGLGQLSPFGRFGRFIEFVDLVEFIEFVELVELLIEKTLTLSNVRSAQNDNAGTMP